MGALMRTHDWLDSPLGLPATWPQSLRSALSTCLNSRAVSAIYWGPEFRLLYNDAYRPFLDERHPWALGRTMAEIWPAMWQSLTASARQVFETGEGVVAENQRLMMEREGGFVESYWFYSFAPILGETGNVEGIFLTALDTTGRALAERQRQEAEAELRAERDRTRRVLDGMAEGFGLLDRNFRVVDINAEGLRLENRPREAIIGKTHWEAWPGSEDSELGQIYKRAMVDRVPVSLDHRYQWEDGREAWLEMRCYPTDDGLALFWRDVTARKQAETLLRGSEAQFRLMADATPQIVWIADRQGRMEFLNKQFVDYTGASPEAWTAAEMAANFMHPEDGPTVVTAFEAALQSGETFDLEHRIRSASGEYRWFLARAVPFRDPDTGEIQRWFGASIDIDDRRRTELALRASEEFNRRILHSSADCIKVLDLDGRLEFMSEGGMTSMEVDDLETVRGACWPDFWQGNEYPKALAAVDEAKRGGAGRFQGFARTMKGSPRWWDVALTPINGADGKPEKLLSVSRDITAVRQAEAALGASEARLSAVFAQASAGFALTDLEGRFVEVNDRYCDMLGRSREKLLGLRMQDLTHAEDLGGNLALFAAAADGGAPFNIEKRYVRPDGSAIWVRNSVVGVRGAEGNVESILAVSIDITDRKAAEESLRALNETLEEQVAARSAERDRLWNLSEDMLARADYSGMMSAVSPAWTRVLGWSEDELLTRAYTTFMHPDDLAPTTEAIGRMAETHRPTRFENRIATSDGEWRHIEWTVAPEPDRVNFIAVGRDLSHVKAREAELAQAQDALRQSQKMEAMGSLTGGVAHDFNNLLTPIIGSLDMLVRKGMGSERERRLIDGALQSAERAKTLVQRLLAFARRQPLQPTAVDVARLVQGMTGLISSTIGPTIDVRTDITEDLPPAKADLNQLEMALLNLAVNARDAMPEGGELFISVKSESVRGRHRSGLQAGEYVLLSVSDTGVGMDQATLERAVEPFFSTKGIGKGTGLGLSMVHGLAAQLGGALVVQSTLGEGTTVELWLPVSARLVGSDGEGVEAVVGRIGRGVALLVDDEELVRMSTADMLVDLGFEVAEASSAEEALRLIKGGIKPDLLVTDHLMPGMTGAELAREARALNPSLPVLVVSGYAEVDGIAPDLPRLTKPFRNAELATSLQALLPATTG